MVALAHWLVPQLFYILSFELQFWLDKVCDGLKGIASLQALLGRGNQGILAGSPHPFGVRDEDFMGLTPLV